MTRFQPPPPPGTGPAPEQAGPIFSSPRKPFSKAAIAGFVLSLLGCLGITAILGLILGIMGVVHTRDQRRRGMGLAIAAIPISLVTGAFGVFALIGVVLVVRSAVMLVQLPAVLATEGEISLQALTQFRQICSTDFNEEVSDEQLRAWFKQVIEKYGKFVTVEKKGRDIVPGGDDRMNISVKTKFVNGSARVTIKLIQDTFWDIRLDDIVIDGSSPRDGP